MTIRRIVTNHDRFGKPVEVFTVTELIDINGRKTDDANLAASIVVHDGTCSHVLDPDYTTIYTVH